MLLYAIALLYATQIAAQPQHKEQEACDLAAMCCKSQHGLPAVHRCSLLLPWLAAPNMLCMEVVEAASRVPLLQASRTAVPSL